jgi:hypothetical protein
LERLINGVSGRAMLEAMIAGQRDPVVLADLAKRRLRLKIPALSEALTGRFSEHHAFLARVHLDLIDRHTRAIEELTDRIEVVVEPFRGFRELICTIPGISTLVADVITAERRRHIPVPQRQPSRLLGGDQPGQQRVRRTGQVDQDQTWQHLSQGRPRHRGDVGGTEQEHLPGGQVPAHRLAWWPGEGNRRRRTCHAHRYTVTLEPTG